MLVDQLTQMNGFTHQEQIVANYILEHLSEMESLSATTLAQQSYTSKATVVRLSQKLGLTGFSELKVKLLVELNQQQRLHRILNQEPITSNSKPNEVLEILPQLYDKAFTNTKLSLSRSHLARITQYLQQAERIELYGVGVTYHLAQAAAFKLATLGREAVAYESLNSHYLTARPFRKTVALMLTFTGANRLVIDMAQYLHETTDTRIIGIAGPYHEELQQWCHDIVEIPNRDSLLSLDVISSFAAANYVLDVFFALLLSKQYDQHVQSSLKMLENKEKLGK